MMGELTADPGLGKRIVRVSGEERREVAFHGIHPVSGQHGADAGTGDRWGFLVRPLESGPGSVVSPRT